MGYPWDECTRLLLMSIFDRSLKITALSEEQNLEEEEEEPDPNNRTPCESIDSLQVIVPSGLEAEQVTPNVLPEFLNEFPMGGEQQSQECSVSSTSDSNKRNREERIIEHIDAASSDSKHKERGKKRTGHNIDLEVLKPYFGKKLKDAAEELGVGRSTIKRACRDYGIDRWPTKAYIKLNPSLFQRQSGSNSQPETTTDHVIVEEEAEKVMIKVQHEEDIIKFDFCLSLGMSKLVEKVATSLKLEVGTLKLKYVDEEDDEILLTSVEDLRLCHKIQITMGRSCIKLFVR